MKCIELIEKFINSDSSITEDDTCIICMTNSRNMIFTPCGHILICKLCYQTNDFEKCCVCNKKVNSSYKLYR